MDCSQIKTSLTNLLKLRNEFAEVYSRLDENLGRHDPANRQAMESSESLMKEIRPAIEQMVSDIDFQKLLNELKPQQQYEAQKKILKDVGLLEELPDGQDGHHWH